MALHWNIGKIKDYKQLVWLPIPDDWDQKAIQASVNMGNGNYCKMPEESEVYTHYWNPVTEALIWATLDVGIGQITEKTYKEFWFRMACADAIYGPRINETDADGNRIGRSITLEEVKQHIGLSTNVSKETTTKWYNAKLSRIKDAN